MPKGLFQVRVNVQDGREDEFLRWYESYFAPYLCTLPGFVSARVMRYRRPAENTNPGGENPYEYTALYELDHEDLNEPLRQLYEVEAGAGERVQITDAVRLDPIPTEWLFEEIFFTPKQDPAIRETLRWAGAESSSELVDSVTSKVLGWVDKESPTST